MRISQLIQMLEQAKDKYGDKNIRLITPDGIRPASTVSRGISFDHEDIVVIDYHRNFPSTTGEPSGKYRDNA